MQRPREHPGREGPNLQHHSADALVLGLNILKRQIVGLCARIRTVSDDAGFGSPLSRRHDNLYDSLQFRECVLIATAFC